jgi:glycine/D-amino acid oxidase-like deaminating enzyme
VTSVVVVGAGVAGTAAAFAAARAGASVTLVDGGSGASTLSTGAIDTTPWHLPPSPHDAIAPGMRPFLDALEAYVVAAAPALVLTTAGIVRPARGHDAALLDVAPLVASRGGRIGVVRCSRPGWDAVSLARAWGPRYDAVEAVVVRYADERVVPDADFAARHDDESRLAWLADRLRDSLARAGRPFDALVLPPCLGIERARARSLSDLLGVPCGEAIGLPGGPSGLRFEAARDRLLAALDIRRVRVRARSVARNGAHWRVTLGDLGDHLDATALVLATGGLLGGGIEYAPSESIFASALPPYSQPPFRLSLDAPLALGAAGSPLGTPGTLFGVAPELLAWPFERDATMDRVGLLTDDDGRAAPGIFVAGELRADRPRTWLDALATGVAAGVASASEGLRSAAVASPWRGEAPPSRS